MIGVIKFSFTNQKAIRTVLDMLAEIIVNIEFSAEWQVVALNLIYIFPLFQSFTEVELTWKLNNS